MLGVGCLILEVAQMWADSDDDKIALMLLGLCLRLLGSFYWLGCVYRFHRILAQFSERKYPIPPLKAVGLQLVPLFCYYWFFRWTRAIAALVNERAGAPRMRRILPGVTLTIASLMGAISIYGALAPLGGVRLLLLFAVGSYIKRMLRASLPEPEPYKTRRLAHLNASMCAGVGAAFTFVLVGGAKEFSHQTRIEKLHDLIAILAVSAGVLIFFEPIFERLRLKLAKAEVHHEMRDSMQHRPWLTRLTVLATLVGASVLEGLLHTEVETGMKKNPQEMIGTLLVALLISGGITYAWIGALHEHRPHATRSGALSGAVLGILLALSLWMAFSGTAQAQAQSPETARELAGLASGPASPEHRAIESGIPFACPWVTRSMIETIRSGSLPSRYILEIVATWMLLGLAGGIAIDRGPASSRTRRVAIAIVTTAVACAIVIHFMDRTGASDIAAHLSAVVGWGLALIACPSSSILNVGGTAGAAELESRTPTG